MATDVIVIRHGETDWNAEGRIQGHSESRLNARGMRQAEAVAERMKGEAFDALYSSDLLRTMQTAEAIANATGKEIVKDARLREWKLGVLEGLRREEARERDAASYRAFGELLPDAPVEGGETIRERAARVTACVTEIAAKHDGETVAIVTHGGPLDDIRRFASGIDLGGEPEAEFYNAGLNRFRVAKGKWEVVAWGDIAHLEGIGAMSDW